jgi:pimeloyl-ACP methyl ester carboxylesterase
MLVHGLAANRHAFHFPGRSLADWLAEHGFDCYIPELRGHGESERRGFDWDLDTYLDDDLPPILEAIREHSGHPLVHWIGHSMGGILLFCYGILHPDAPIASGLAVGSALDYRVGHSDFLRLWRLRSLLERVPAIPFGTVTHVLAPLLGRLADPLTRFNVQLDNIEPEMCRRMYATAFHSIPTSLLASLATTFEEGGLRNRTGTLYYVDEADRFTIPLRLYAGTGDLQVSVEAVRHTAELLGGEVRVFGRAFAEQHDYGHWDLLIGRFASEEVWPDILEWMESASHRQARSA